MGAGCGEPSPTWPQGLRQSVVDLVDDRLNKIVLIDLLDGPRLLNKADIT